MTAAMPATGLAAAWDQLLAQVGAFARIEGVDVQPTGAYRIALVTCRFERARITVKLVFAKTGKIAGLFFAPAAEVYRIRAAGHVHVVDDLAGWILRLPPR